MQGPATPSVDQEAATFKGGAQSLYVASDLGAFSSAGFLPAACPSEAAVIPPSLGAVVEDAIQLRFHVVFLLEVL